MRKPRQWRTRSMASAQTCCANSRVGHKISAPGVAGLKLRVFVGSLRLAFFSGASPRATASALCRSNSAFSSRSACSCCINNVCNTGNRNAAVLPLPVWLDTSKSVNFCAFGSASKACIAFGMVAICTAVGWVNPISATAWSNSLARPSFTKPLGTSTTASSDVAGATTSSDEKSGITLMSRLDEATTSAAGRKSSRVSKESVMFFLTNPPVASSLNRFWTKNGKLHPCDAEGFVHG